MIQFRPPACETSKRFHLFNAEMTGIVKKERISNLETEITTLERKKQQMSETDRGGGEIMQAIRLTENKIEKVLLKQTEAVHIGQTYLAIFNKLKEEGHTYLTTADALRLEIERCSRKINELRPIYQDAVLIRDKTKTELRRHEELLYAHRKRRELEIGSMRRLVEAKREKPMPQKAAMNLLGQSDTFIDLSLVCF
ncbi:unnamed protein product [Echinostoma caproni]|uniref:DUF4201 domain-containing protein n=1 Tax=Echinostoma caproni TaxID=27848 RepID=A0A183AN41_9TREM|nr:unnamed protein product [Echinostoma caproni]